MLEEDDYEFWQAERERFGRLVDMAKGSSFVAWVCPSCGSLQRSPRMRNVVPRCSCGAEKRGDDLKPQLRRDYVPPRIPTAERCAIGDRTNEVARRLVESALG